MYIFYSSAFELPSNTGKPKLALLLRLGRFMDAHRHRRKLRILRDHLASLDDRTLIDMGIDPLTVPRSANRDFHANAIAVCGRLSTDPWQRNQL